MSGTRFLDWLGAAALPLALVAMFLLFVPGLVRAENLNKCFSISVADAETNTVLESAEF